VAEQAIRTFKNHFIAGLCSVDKDFPIHLWDRLLPQAELTLNLLRGSRLDPTISAWAELHGPFDFNRTPIAPPGIRVLIHEKPSVRGTWAPHAVEGWYLGPALNSYRCYTVWSKDTRAQCICDTLTWLPHHVPMPNATSDDYIIAGLQDIATALRYPAPSSPLAPIAASQVDTLEQLMRILHGTTKADPAHKTVPTQPIPGSDKPAPPKAPGQTPPPLRVEAPSQTPPPLRVEAPRQPPPPLRVIPPLEHLGTPDDVTVVASNRTPDNVKGIASNRIPTSAPPRVTRSMRKPRRSPRHAAHHATSSNQTAWDAALHGNAFNPDTGELAEYKELSQSSDGHLWQMANATEIIALHKAVATPPGATQCSSYR